MRPRFSALWLGLTAVLATVVGFFSYQAGWSAGLAARLPAGAAVPYYAYGPHFGFGFFGLPFLLLLVILLFAFRGRRRWGPGGWGPGPWRPGAGAASGGPQPPPAAGEPIHDWPQRPEEPAGPGPRQS